MIERLYHPTSVRTRRSLPPANRVSSRARVTKVAYVTAILLILEHFLDFALPIICVLSTLFTPDDLEWLVGEWGPCLVAENQILEYGTGLMQRNVTCSLSARTHFNVSIDTALLTMEPSRWTNGHHKMPPILTHYTNFHSSK